MCDNKTNLLLMLVNGVTVLVGILVTICGVLGILNQASIQEYSGGFVGILIIFYFYMVLCARLFPYILLPLYIIMDPIDQ